MFNGIIASTGTITMLQRSEGGGARIRISGGRLAASLKSGDSVSVDGICLTVVRKKGREIEMDISAETWKCTNLIHRKLGHRVNLELPVSASTFISGHFVQGHVEGVARVVHLICNGDDVRLVLNLPPDLIPYCIPKGSIAVNGVSLTIASAKNRRVEIALIPYTLEVTNLCDLQPSDTVNIETDIVGRYVVSTVKKEYHNLKSKL